MTGIVELWEVKKRHSHGSWADFGQVSSVSVLGIVGRFRQTSSHWIRENLPSGKLTQLLKVALEIVDLPINNGDFPQLCKRLPEGYVSESYFKDDLAIKHGGVQAIVNQPKSFGSYLLVI